MQFGVSMFPASFAMPVVALAKAAEERGFESLFVPEHTHIPVHRETPWSGGGEPPPEYSHTLDPFVALAAAAATTSRIRRCSSAAMDLPPSDVSSSAPTNGCRIPIAATNHSPSASLNFIACAKRLAADTCQSPCMAHQPIRAPSRATSPPVSAAP